MKISATLAPQAPLRAPTLLRGGLVRGVYRAAELGFDGVELQCKLPGQIDVPGLKRALAETGLTVSALATGTIYTQDGVSLISDDAEVCAEARRRLMAYVDLADELGGKVIVGCARGNLCPEDSLTAMEARLADNLRPVLAYAAKHGQTVVLEAINHFENNYLQTAASCADFLRRYELDGLELLLDTYHMNLEEADQAGAIRTAGAKLGHFHLADNTRLAPGLGCYDFAAALRALHETGYNGWLSFECAVGENEDREAEAGLRHIRQLLAQTCAGGNV